MPGKRLIFYCVLVVALFYMVVLQVLAIWPFTIDDMYISLRYARNLATGHGLVWNYMEPAVEGYSNFGFVILAAGAIYWGIDPVLSLKLAGLFGLLFLLPGLYLISRFLLPIPMAWLPVITLLLYRGQIVWSASGLETTCYQAVIVFSLFFLLKALGFTFYQASQPSRLKNSTLFDFIAWPALLIIAALLRFEGVFLFFLFYLGAFLAYQDKRNFVNSNFSLSLLIFLAVYGIYFWWRWHYFGRLLPNPFYCKGFSEDNQGYLDGQYLKVAGFFMMAAFFALKKYKIGLLYFYLAPSFLYLLLLWQADPIVAFDNRLFLPAFALLLPGAYAGLYQIFCLVGNVWIQRSGLSILAVILLIFIPHYNLQQYQSFTKNPLAGENLRRHVLEWLNQNVANNSTVVLADSGFIPFYSSLNFTDSYCLNNRKMVDFPASKRYQYFCNSVLRLAPQVIILTSLLQEGKTTYTPADACLYRKLKQTPSYRLAASLQTNNQDSAYRYEIYERKI